MRLRPGRHEAWAVKHRVDLLIIDLQAHSLSTRNYGKDAVSRQAGKSTPDRAGQGAIQILEVVTPSRVS